MIEPGQTIGILGGGQLARMLCLAAAELGLRTIVLDPDKDAPAAHVASRHICASFADANAIVELCSSAAVVTHEWENVPLECVHKIAERIPVLPSPRALETKQDRLREKQFLTGLKIEVAAFADISSPDDIAAAEKLIGFPAVLKTRREGYDGKGQAKVSTRGELETAFKRFARPCCLEAFVKFDGEASIVAARGADGSFAAFDFTENTHTSEHILKTSHVPARWNGDLARRAQLIVQNIAEALHYIGVLGVEFFVIGQELIVNEIAPRVHNSGHWTIDAAETSQFTQHIRAICGWPLGNAKRHSDAVMTNLIGDDVNEWRAYLKDPNAHLHLYGKRETRAGRKMGHVTHTFPLGRSG
ncbi:MAG: 5-(carboxyamino)imidazole ribonucleotide synthase [Alphaproteobacteria bacterium]